MNWFCFFSMVLEIEHKATEHAGYALYQWATCALGKHSTNRATYLAQNLFFYGGLVFHLMTILQWTRLSTFLRHAFPGSRWTDRKHSISIETEKNLRTFIVRNSQTWRLVWTLRSLRVLVELCPAFPEKEVGGFPDSVAGTLLINAPAPQLGPNNSSSGHYHTCFRNEGTKASWG